MAKMATTKNRPFLAWTIGACNLLWKYVVVPFWMLVVLNVAVNALTARLGDPRQFDATLNWVHDNSSLVIIITLVLVFLSTLIFVVRFLPVVESEREARRRYLADTILERRGLTFRGVPSEYVPNMVNLEDVFIPLLFHISKPLDVYAPTPEDIEDIKLQRRRLAQGADDQEIVRFLHESNRIERLKESSKVDIGNLWEHLTEERPVAVIQGFAGAGKSTLMYRLALHMARRGLKQRDADPSFASVTPALIPIFVSLGEYATHYKKAIQDKQNPPSLLDYIKVAAKNSYNLDQWIEKWLNDCSCLILLDALDVVSDEETRKAVQQEIRKFCDTQSRSDKEHKRTYNRFLITSRVSGYDTTAFKDYCLHYLIADLDEKQIAGFLPRWFEFNVLSDKKSAEKVQVRLEAKEKAARFMQSVKQNSGVCNLAEIPLLLTLLASMQQQDVELLRNRAQLYRMVTKKMLEERNLLVTTAIERLGPVAYEMHDEGNSFARRPQILAILQDVMSSEYDRFVPEDAAALYLDLISGQGGLFVKRVGDAFGDYYGFFHRTFEEYFAARHVLAQIKVKSDDEIREFVELARRADDLWREPYLLAVSSKSNEDRDIASKLIRILATTPATADAKSVVHDVCLAAIAIVESEYETIYSNVQREVAEKLLRCYTSALQERRFTDCENIEKILRDWLLNLKDISERAPLLLVLREVISDGTNVIPQRSTLTLLTMVAQQLVDGPITIFSTLVPVLLKLADLPVVEGFQIASDVVSSSHFDVIDLVLTTLSFMGKRGPAGALLTKVKQDFSVYLPQLARYSLESSTLITPTVVPLTEGNYREYERTVGQWITLRDQCKKRLVTEKDVQACSSIHASLLAWAEEVRYPTAYHLLNMLQASQNSSNWQQSWQHYLLDMLHSGKYIDYQQITLLWAMLFLEQEMTTLLANTIMEHFADTNIYRQRNAQRFIATLAEDLRYLSELGYLGYLRYLSESKYLSDLRQLRYLSDLGDLRYLSELGYLGYLRRLRQRGEIRDLRQLRYLRDLGDLRELVLVQEVSEKVMKVLPALDPVQYIDLLMILLGRVLQVQEVKEEGSEVEREIQEIVQSARESFLTASADEVKEAALDILRYLPVRSATEITFVMQCAETTSEERIQGACAIALRYAKADTPEKEIVLQAGKASSVKAICDAVEKALS